MLRSNLLMRIKSLNMILSFSYNLNISWITVGFAPRILFSNGLLSGIASNKRISFYLLFLGTNSSLFL